MTGRLSCPYCDKTYADTSEGWSSRYQHAKAKHKGRSLAGIRFAESPFYEPSMAELLIEAKQAHAAGAPVDEAMMLTFPDEFKS